MKIEKLLIFILLFALLILPEITECKKNSIKKSNKNHNKNKRELIKIKM